MEKRSCLKILISVLFLATFFCAPVFSMEKDAESPSDIASVSQPMDDAAIEPPIIDSNAIHSPNLGKRNFRATSVGDSRFPVKGRAGMPSVRGSIRNSMNHPNSGQGVPAYGASDRKGKPAGFSASNLSPEKLREAYTAGYARTPVSPYAGIPQRMRNSEPSLMQEPEWNEKYRKNSFKGTRPVPLSLNPSLMNSSSNPNEGISKPLSKGRNYPKSVIIEKNNDQESSVGISPGMVSNMDIPIAGGAQNIRILLKRTSGSVVVETPSGLLVSGGEDSIGVTRIKGKIVLDAKEGKIVSGDKEISERICQIKPSVSSIKVDGKNYRGNLTIHAEGNTLTVVNHLPMEAYLLGVVSSEMPASWSDEALKAQAVASRSYAFFHMQDNSGRLWDLDDTEGDQVYGGKDAEKPRTTLAVYGTKGQILLYGGKPAEALFHADSGGYTDSPGDVWKKDYPYLRSINDKFTSAGGPFKWEYFVPLDRFFSRLRSAGIKADKEDEVRVAERTRSGRVQQVAVGDSFISGNRLRQILDPDEMKSAKYDVKEYGGGFLFSGKGYGHGVGLSQNGAKQMAEMGYSYKDILKYYYRGVCVGRMSALLYANRENPYRKKELYQ